MSLNLNYFFLLRFRFCVFGRYMTEVMLCSFFFQFFNYSWHLILFYISFRCTSVVIKHLYNLWSDPPTSLVCYILLTASYQVAQIFYFLYCWFIFPITFMTGLMWYLLRFSIVKLLLFPLINILRKVAWNYISMPFLIKLSMSLIMLVWIHGLHFAQWVIIHYCKIYFDAEIVSRLVKTFCEH